MVRKDQNRNEWKMPLELFGFFEGDMEAAWTEESGPVHLGSCLEQCSSCNGHLSLREEYPARRLCCMCGIREKTTERFKDRWRDPFESALIIGRQFRLLNRDKPRIRRFHLYFFRRSTLKIF